ncbi:hypothetical protein IG631_03450 [Alternaria alternata]|nr:hypothetical protein IG631_03450 [Alternaria alternata]
MPHIGCQASAFRGSEVQASGAFSRPAASLLSAREPSRRITPAPTHTWDAIRATLGAYLSLKKSKNLASKIENSRALGFLEIR